MNALRRFEPYAYALLRIVAGLLFLFHGLQKFGLLGGQMVPLMSLVGAAAVIETVGGLLIMIGLQAAPVAFICSGEMAYAYFTAHQPRGTWPISERRRARGAVRVHLSLHRDARLGTAERERRQVSAADAALIRACGGRIAARAAGRLRAIPGAAITAAQVAERIRANVGTAWREKTIDGFKAGSPETPVTGIVTTVMATQRVLARAVELGRNLVVTQEPVFYNANDEPGNRASDAIYLAKKAYIEQHGLVVFRFADHWNARQPDPRVAALARALSWDGPGTNGVFAIRETTLVVARRAPS